MTSLSSELKYLKRSLKKRRELLSVCSTIDGYKFYGFVVISLQTAQARGRKNLRLISDKSSSKYKIK